MIKLIVLFICISLINCKSIVNEDEIKRDKRHLGPGRGYPGRRGGSNSRGSSRFPSHFQPDYDFIDPILTWQSDMNYDYYDWVCTDSECQLCDMLTSECCNPSIDINCFLPDSCLNDPCLGGGTCISTKTVDNNPDFICVCLPGSTGKYCQLDAVIPERKKQVVPSSPPPQQQGSYYRDQPASYSNYAQSQPISSKQNSMMSNYGMQKQSPIVPPTPPVSAYSYSYQEAEPSSNSDGQYNGNQQSSISYGGANMGSSSSSSDDSNDGKFMGIKTLGAKGVKCEPGKIYDAKQKKCVDFHFKKDDVITLMDFEDMNL